MRLGEGRHADECWFTQRSSHIQRRVPCAYRPNFTCQHENEVSRDVITFPYFYMSVGCGSMPVERIWVGVGVGVSASLARTLDLMRHTLASPFQKNYISRRFSPRWSRLPRSLSFLWERERSFYHHHCSVDETRLVRFI